MTILGFCVYITIFGNVLSATLKNTTTEKTLPLRGPRDDLNETGRFLFPHPHTGADLLCKNCSRRALYNGQYKNEQEVYCINKNFDKLQQYDGLEPPIYPYCKVGTDLGCGQPPFTANNSHWECNPGYSPTHYSVYSTCQLICNTSNTAIGQIYCSELLVWHVDQNLAEHCLEPVPPPNKGDQGQHDSQNFTLVVCGITAAVILVVGILMCIVCYCRRKKRLSRPPSSDIVENGPSPPEQIPLTNQKQSSNVDQESSIGDCSIAPEFDDGLADDNMDETDKLLPKEKWQTQKVDMSTSTSTLNTFGQSNHQLAVGQDGAEHQAGQSDLGVSNRSASSQTDNEHCVKQKNLGASSRCASSKTDNADRGQEDGPLNSLSDDSQIECVDDSTEAGRSEVRKATQDLSATTGSSSTDSVQNGHENRSGNRQGRLRSSCTSNSSHTDCEQGNRFQNGFSDEQQTRKAKLGDSNRSRVSNTDSEQSGWENENQCPTQSEQQIVPRGLRDSGSSSNTDIEQEIRQKGLRSSDRSESSQNNNEPYLKIFALYIDSYSRCYSGSNRLQEDAHSVQAGSSVFFIPSQTDVISVLIVRKDEGPPFRGITYLRQNNFVLEVVTFEDAGLYMYTITWEQDGEIKTRTDAFELFVGNRDIPYNNRVTCVVNRNPQLENQQLQRATVHEPTQLYQPEAVERSNVAQMNVSHNAPTPARLPPEGAENEAPQGSGQGHPKFNGARPKTKVVHNFSPTVVSGASVGGVKDPQPMRNTLSNNLDLSVITAGGDKTKMVALNIKQGLPSMEDNRLTQPLVDKVKDKDASLQELQSSEHLDINSLFSSKGNSYSQQNDLNHGEVLSNSDNVTNNSVELTSEQIHKLKEEESNLDLSDLLDSKITTNPESNSINVRNPIGQGQLLDGPKSLSHLNPDTLNEDIRQASRPDPSGRSEEPEVIEHNRQETEPKTIYRRNEGVRGEQTGEDSSAFNQPQAHVRLSSSDRVNSQQGYEGHDESTADRVDPVVGHVGEARRELTETVQGAEGGAVPAVNGLYQQNRALHHVAVQCKTFLKDLKDKECLQHVYWLGNPREKKPDAKTWFGLCEEYGHERHELEALAFAQREDHNKGPMHHALTVMLPEKNLTVGHVVLYYTQESSFNPDIVERLVEKCKDHVNCKYCQELSRNAKLKYQYH